MFRPTLTPLLFFFFHVDNVQMRSIVRDFVPFRICSRAGYVYRDSRAVLKKYPYQPGVGGCTSNSLGCTDIWWQFIYL